MGRILVSLCMALVVSSAGAEGFFRPIPDSMRLPSDAAPGIPKASFACALQVRYDAPFPDRVELTFIGGSECLTRYLQAATTALAQAGVAPPKVAGEPALPATYQCTSSVNFDPATAGTTVNVVHSGSGCDSARSMAMAAARQGVACHYTNVRCRL